MAYICRFANQSIFDLLGRDPQTQPLSILERSLFQRAIRWLLEQEFGEKK